MRSADHAARIGPDAINASHTVAHVDWQAAGVIAISSIIGGQAGSVVGRRLNPLVLRLVIVAARVAAMIKLLLP